jgi:protein subunit release factor B
LIDEARERASAERGRHAKALLDDPILQEAFATVDAAIIEAWRKTPHRDAEARENLFKAASMLPKVRDALGEVIANGELSAATLRSLSGERPGVIARMVGR